MNLDNILLTINAILRMNHLLVLLSIVVILDLQEVFHHIGAWGDGSRNPHSSSQNAGGIGVFMVYNHHITQSDRQQIYDYYKDTVRYLINNTKDKILKCLN
ncbi:MAG: hypothetical protein CM15mV11_2930 [Caudoviricetes sp.]|nr:MAG: hypothetical protein CM15mV11_2930 [Caudoviricetes sp.]